MSLSELQKKLFYNFVRYHIKVKEPIGSKVLSRKLKRKFAASTLRLYLRQLVFQGYLENTDDFTGRVPTDKGWYFYLSNYELNPEIKTPTNLDLKDLENISFLTKNVIFYQDEFGSRLVVKGLKYLIEEISDKKFVADILNVLDCLDKIVSNVQNFEVCIGNDLVESETKNLSMIIYRDQKRIFSFLGHKINYYHTNLTLIKRFFGDGRKTTITPRR